MKTVFRVCNKNVFITFKMSEENVSKPNGLGVDPMKRLASFKPPRDYSLGAAKPNKKVFTPNLNVARNKNKGSSNNTRDHKKEEKGKKDRKNDRNKNFRNSSNIIKSAGVFSEGLGSGERHTRSSYAREGSDSGSVQLQRPTIRVKDVVKIDRELEEQKIRMAMGTQSDIEVEDFKANNDNEAPVKLPMDDISWSKNRSKQTVQVKKEVIVKTEPEGADDPDSTFPRTETDGKAGLGVKVESFDETDVVDVLRSDNPALMLIKLPDTLPGRGGASDDDGPPRRRAGQEPSTSSGTKEENTTVDNKCYLKNLEEGKIGKLLIRRSGRVTLRLGDTDFEVSLGTKSAFHQEVVSVGADTEARSARLVSLGPLEHKLTIVPDWDSMFLDIPS